jgi:cysteinyl-tRNA synthetase
VNKIQQQHYLKRESLANNELDFFFEVVLKRLGQELERLRDSIFDNYICHPTVYEDIFGLNEQAWVGVLNNAIIRAFSDTANTLQEFTVYNIGKDNVEIRTFNGRADLLVQWKNSKGENVYLLFEAKQNRESDFSKMHEDISEFIEKIFDQGNSYIDADKVYYQDKLVFVVPIVFGWIRGAEFINSAKEYFNKNNKQEAFCSLYHECNSGAWVYGTVYDSNGNKLK